MNTATVSPSSPKIPSYLPYKTLQLKAGNNIAYLDVGQGPSTIIFLHGLATYSGSWMHNIEVLQKDFRCIALDFPGNGYSDKGDLPYGMHYFSKVVIELIEALGLTQVHLCGHSMGGQVALTLGIHYPQWVQKMILCAPAGFEHFSFYEKQFFHAALGFAGMWADEKQYLKQFVYNSFYQSPEQSDPMLAELFELLNQYTKSDYRSMIEACIQAMLNEEVWTQLKKCKPETLVLFGDMDQLIPNKLIHPYSTELLAKDAVAKLPNAQLKMLTYAGHFIQWEKAQEVNQAIKHFLNQH